MDFESNVRPCKCRLGTVATIGSWVGISVYLDANPSWAGVEFTLFAVVRGARFPMATFVVPVGGARTSIFPINLGGAGWAGWAERWEVDITGGVVATEQQATVYWMGVDFGGSENPATRGKHR